MFKWLNPLTQITSKLKQRPSVPSSWKAPYNGNCRCNGTAEGAKNPWVRSGCHTEWMKIATEDRIEELELELEKIKWDVLGISETRQRDKGYTELQSGLQGTR